MYYELNREVFGDAVDRLTARMNLIFDKVNKL